MATTVADLEARVIALETAQADATPFVGYVMNNWETRPALILSENDGLYDLAVFSKGEIDGFENASGYVIKTDVKKNNSKHIPNTWHNAEA